MKKFTLKKISVKNKYLLFSYFVCFSLFVSENVFAIEKQFKEDFINVKWNGKGVDIDALVYNYSDSKYGYLEQCTFEATDNITKYYKLMEIKTARQPKTELTAVALFDKLAKADFGVYVHGEVYQKNWQEQNKGRLTVRLDNAFDKANIKLTWTPDKDHSKVQLIRIKGKWHLKGTTSVEGFTMVVNLKRPLAKHMKQSDDQKVNTEVKEINTVEVFGESDAIVVKGADSTANIKICNQAGVVIKSVVANKDLVRINLSAKHLYLVHVGNSQYKVAL